MTTRLDTITPAPQSERLKFENTPELAVLRIKQRKRGWVPISRALIDDARLQFDTRGVATWLIAKPDGWQIRLGALPYLLQQRAGPGERMGRDRVRRMLRELENAGYLTRARSKKRNGRWAWRVDLSDTAVPFYRSSTMDASAVDGQGVDLLNTLNNSRLDKLIPTTTTEPKATENAVVVTSSDWRHCGAPASSSALKRACGGYLPTWFSAGFSMISGAKGALTSKSSHRFPSNSRSVRSAPLGSIST